MYKALLVTGVVALASISSNALAASGAATGAAGGAITGAIVGGPVGAAVGGVAGAITGAVLDPPREVVTYVQPAAHSAGDNRRIGAGRRRPPCPLECRGDADPRSASLRLCCHQPAARYRRTENASRRPDRPVTPIQRRASPGRHAVVLEMLHDFTLDRLRLREVCSGPPKRPAKWRGPPGPAHGGASFFLRPDAAKQLAGSATSQRFAAGGQAAIDRLADGRAPMTHRHTFTSRRSRSATMARSSTFCSSAAWRNDGSRCTPVRTASAKRW